MDTEERAADGRASRLAREFDEALELLAASPPFARARYQEDVFRLASDLLADETGLDLLIERAGRFEESGVFDGGPWEDSSSLVPDLVGGGLMGEGVYPTLETLSELRMLAIAKGDAVGRTTSREEAATFLRTVTAKNLDLVFPGRSEASRRAPKLVARAQRLFARVADHVPLTGLRAKVVEEIEAVLAQAPVRTDGVERRIALALRLPADDDGREASNDENEDTVDARLAALATANHPLTPRAQQAGDLVAYRADTGQLALDDLVDEARPFVDRLRSTGIASPYLAVLLRRVARLDAARLVDFLPLGDGARAEVRTHAELVGQLVRMAIFPHTTDAILGLVGVLERGLCSRSEVTGGLRRLMELEIGREADECLQGTVPGGAGVSSLAVLMGGVLAVLGRPLGVGQGNNPTCQSARGISLWSLHAPGQLLGMVATAARDGHVDAEFEGQVLRSDQLLPGLSRNAVDPDLDAVSALLVPHLDRIYSAMMTLAAGRGEDPHRWVNPAMYGRWVVRGFASAFDAITGGVVRHRAFVQRFVASHHPEYNGGHRLIYPNPVGIMVTDVHGRLLGPHAVSIQRIAVDPDGALRVYFYNPNDEGRQDWGQGIKTSVTGHGEIPGESSLPFAHFAARLYAFHYDPREEGDSYAVPAELITEISTLAAESWGRAGTFLP